MITIKTEKQIQQVDTDINVRIRHHAQPVQRVVDILKLCILSNNSLKIEAMGNGVNRRLGYCYKITAPSQKSYYITYNHDTQQVFIKDKMRNFKVLHTFNNNASELDIINTVRNTFI